MKKNFTFFGLFLIMVLMITTPGCLPCISGIHGSGNIIRQDRNVAEFSKVVVEGQGDVIVKQGETQSVNIETDDNIMQYITTRVSGGVLTIDSDENISPKKLIIHLTMKNIEGLKIEGSGSIRNDSPIKTGKISLYIEGSGDIKLNDILADGIKAEISGSGDVKIGKGTCREMFLKISGSGEMNARECETDNCEASIYGSGTCHIAAKNLLEASIYGSGDIYYYGEPKQLKTSVSGSGSIIKK
ncbi:MAG: hypothetical protein HW421_3021 [Ignavibacteria bacterium]|nr:hypothetical protein [Ignavibacteria bacterium]